MFELKKIITAIILPPFNIIILWLLSLILAKFNFKKLAKLCGLLGLCLFYILSIPYTAQTLEDHLIEEDNLSLDDYKQAQAIVLLGGGLRDSKELYAPLVSTATQFERLRYTAFLQKQTQLPLLITGASSTGAIEAKVAATELNNFFNVPTQWIEPQALTTKENAVYSKKILESQNINKIILVTNEWHMKRAKFLFEQQGIKVLPASVGEGITPESYGLTVMHFIPQGGAISKNMQLLKEWIGYFKEKYISG